MQHFIDSLNAFKHAVSGTRKGEWRDLTTHNLDEFRSWSNQMLQAEKSAISKGYKVKFQGQIKGPRRVTWLISNGLVFKVLFEPKGRKSSATSINAYKNIDFSTQEGQVAFQILTASLNGSDLTRAEIGHKMNLENSSVCGRVRSLLDKYGEGGFYYNNQEYRLEVSKTRVSIFPGASKVANEALRFVKTTLL